MFFPQEFISPLLYIGDERKTTQKRSFCITDYVIFYKITIYQQRMYSYNVVRTLRIMWTFSFHYNLYLTLL